MTHSKFKWRLKSTLRPVYRLWQRWVDPVLPLRQMITAAAAYPDYFQDWVRYQTMPQAETLTMKDAYPCLRDRLPTTPFDPHYLYQAVWATEQVVQSGANFHVDVGSDIRFAALLASHLSVTFIDIRPLTVDISNFSSLAGNLISLPLADASVMSLSCLHVIEHVGLGRYGDSLDPTGTRQSCVELQRVIAPGGNLFLSTPVGQPRVQFNAHRIHTPAQILSMMPELKLVQFAGVDDFGNLVRNADLSQFAKSTYACGLFWLRKENGRS